MQSPEISFLKKPLPRSWDEITVRQYNLIRSLPPKGGFISLMSILSGLPVSDWQNAELTDEQIDSIHRYLSWIEPIDFNTLPCPDEIKIKERSVKIPKDLTILPLACKMYLEEKVLPLCRVKTDEEGKQYVQGLEPDAIPFALSAYLYKPYYDAKSFSSDDIEELENLINGCIITKAFPVAAFFLIRYFKCENVKEKKSFTQKMRIRKKQVSKNLENSEI